MREGRKKEASKIKQTTKQSNTAHLRQSHEHHYIHSHAHTLTHTLTLTHSHAHTHTHTLTLTRSHSHTHTHTLTHSHSQVQLKGSLQELFSERRQLQQDVESAKSNCARFESIARRLKEQNEVLCERVRDGEMGGGEIGRGKSWCAIHTDFSCTHSIFAMSC